MRSVKHTWSVTCLRWLGGECDDMSARGGRGRGGGSGAAAGAWRGSGERRGRGGRPGLYKVKDVSEDSRIDIEALRHRVVEAGWHVVLEARAGGQRHIKHHDGLHGPERTLGTVKRPREQPCRHATCVVDAGACIKSINYVESIPSHQVAHPIPDLGTSTAGAGRARSCRTGGPPSSARSAR